MTFGVSAYVECLGNIEVIRKFKEPLFVKFSCLIVWYLTGETAHCKVT